MALIGLATIGLIDSAYIQKGDPARFLKGVDYKGNICGSSGILEKLKEKWVPNSSGINIDSLGNNVPSGFSICVSSCPGKGQKRSDPYGIYGDWTASVNTLKILNYCTTADNDGFIGDLSLSFLGDFLRAITVISVTGFGLSALLSFLFLSVMRLHFVLKGLVWGFIILIFLLLGLGSFVFLVRVDYGGGILSSTTGVLRGVTASDNLVEIRLSTFFGGALAIKALLWICLVCFMRDRIALAVDFIRESSKVFSSMPFLLFFPIIQVMLYAAFTAGWAICFFYLASSGTVVVKNSTGAATGSTYKVMKYSDDAKYTLIFMLFGWFWNIAFLEAYGQLISAHSVLIWYFADARKKIGSMQVIRSSIVITKFHLGTAAFGSLLLAFIKSLRTVLEYIKYRSNPKTSCIIKYSLCCLTCCLWFFDLYIKYLNKHAYIQCALFGTGFFQSAKNGFKLIVRNLGRTAAISMVGDFVVLIVKIVISLLCAALAYAYMTIYMSDKMRGIVLPTILVLFLSFFTSTLFLNVISATADTISQAYITDEEHNVGKINMSHENCENLKLAIEEQRKGKGINGDDDEFIENFSTTGNDDESKDDKLLNAEINESFVQAGPRSSGQWVELTQRERVEKHMRDMRKDGSDQSISLGLDLSRIKEQQQQQQKRFLAAPKR